MFLKSIYEGLKFWSGRNCQISKLRFLSSDGINTNSERQPSQINFLMQLLECTYYNAHKIVTNHKYIKELDRQRLKKVVAMCKKFNIDTTDIIAHPEVLVILAQTVEHHTMLLQESGFTSVDAYCLVNYIPLIKKRISLLQAYGYLPDPVNVGATMLSHLTPVPPIKPPPHDPEASLYDVHITMLRRYLAWRLDASDRQIDDVMKTYVRVRHKSLRLVQRSLRLMQEEVGLSNDKILKNAYLIHCQPNNIQRILTEVPTIGGVPVREVLAKHPKIAVTLCDTIMDTARHLQEYGLSDEAIRRCPEVFTLASASVKERLVQLQRVPEFSVLGSHPRILRLVYYQRKARTRLAHLQQMRVKCASLHILSAPVSLFEKYAREGADKTKGMDVTRFLSVALDHDEQEIRQQLTRHNYWCHVPLLSVKQTLDLLLGLRFTTQQIFKSLHVLLYPKDRVAAELNNLPRNAELQPGTLVQLSESWSYDASDSSSSSSSSSSDSDTEMAPASTDRRLDFVLYFMEREHHFTGDGVWPKPGDQALLAESTALRP